MFCDVCNLFVQPGDGVSPDGRGQVHKTCLSSTAGSIVTMVESTGWKSYNVDGYQFSIKADGQGGLLIEREPLR